MSAMVSRRAFLKQIAWGTGALGAAAVLGQKTLSSSAFAQAPPAAPNPSIRPFLPGTEFFQGEVAAVEGGIVMINADKGLQALVVSTDTFLWKGGPTTIDAVYLGDFLYARGIPMPDGTIAVVRMWVNIVNLVGLNEHYARGRARLRRMDHGGQLLDIIDVDISRKTIIDNGWGSPLDIPVGRPIRVIGVLERDGTVKATRVWRY